MSRSVRPRIGRTRLQPDRIIGEPTFQGMSTDVAEPMAPVVEIAPSVKAATVADIAPAVDLAALTVSDPRLTALRVKEILEAKKVETSLVDQPTSHFSAHLTAYPQVQTHTAEEPAKTKSGEEQVEVDGPGVRKPEEEMPIWEQATAQIPAPRLIPTTSQSVSDTPLEMMLRQLRVRKPKPLSMIRTSSRSALESIWTNRLRSLLTTLSIFIGVAAVIVALILMEGASAYFTDIIAGLGNNSIIVDAGTYSSGGVMARQSIQTLTPLDAITLKNVPHVIAVSPIVYVGNKIVYSGKSLSTDVQGVDTSMLNIRGWELGEGFWFNSVDDSASRPVAVLGATVARNFYNAEGVDPVGETITINGKAFRVIGVLTARGGFNLDNVVFIPYHTTLNRLNMSAVDRIEVQVDTPLVLDQVQQRITLLLRQHHRIPRGSPNDFQIMPSSQLLQQTEQELQAMTVLLISSSAILLTAGGIGIINIMLASVTGRTREIGIRIAVGAQRGEIRNQFLIEALLLCLVGGGSGIFAGLLGGFELTRIIGAPFIVTPLTFIMPFAVSTFIGVVFGLYPAVKAAQLDPVVALRRSLS